MADNLTISVVLPTFNRGAVLAEAVESVLAQTRPAEQVIVVDDGSTEDPAPLLARFAGRIEFIRQSNAGVSAARTTAIAHARGDWIAFQDSDDLWRPERLATFVRDITAAGNEAGDIVAHLGNIVYTGIGHDVALFSLKEADVPHGRAVRLDDPLPFVISGMSLQGATIRRDAFHRAGDFDLSMRYLEDTSLFCQLALTGPFLVTADIIAEVRRTPGDAIALTSLERKNPLEARQMHVRYLEALLARPLTPAQSLLVRQQLSGALYREAEVVTRTDRAAARRILARAARLHPSPLKGWSKSAVAGLLGPRGFALLDRDGASRPDRS